MEKSGVTRRDIEARLGSVGDYVKIDFLSQCLRKDLDFDTRKFVQTKLALIYETKLMFTEAGKLMANAAEINATFDGKVNDYVKSADLFIKGGSYEDAETSFAKALASANNVQKGNIKAKKREMYLKNAQDLMKKDKRKNAMVAYEKTLSYVNDLAPSERKDIQNILMGLYEKLGRIREFYNMQRATSTNTVIGTQKTEQKPNQFRNPNFRDMPSPPKRPSNDNSVSGDDIDLSVDDLIGN